MLTSAALRGAAAGAVGVAWPRDELAVDLLHKGVHSAVTGFLCDRVVAQQPRPLPGAVSH